jgi:hypothetical protein
MRQLQPSRARRRGGRGEAGELRAGFELEGLDVSEGVVGNRPVPVVVQSRSSSCIRTGWRSFVAAMSISRTFVRLRMCGRRFRWRFPGNHGSDRHGAIIARHRLICAHSRGGQQRGPAGVALSAVSVIPRALLREQAFGRYGGGSVGAPQAAHFNAARRGAEGWGAWSSVPQWGPVAISL